MKCVRIAAASALLACLLVCSASLAGPAAGLPAADAADTVRTNLWLVEALFGEVFHAAAQGLPAAPAKVQVVPGTDDAADELAREAAVRTFRGLGYEVYLSDADSTAVPLDYRVAYRVQEVKLVYPSTERTLGIWRRSVARHVGVAVTVDVTSARTGQVLYSQRVRRSIDDRVGSDDLALVDSAIYPFTSAPVGESGWQRRSEEFVVLATLAGLVAVYFANTGD